MMFSYVLPKVAQPLMNIRQEQRSLMDAAHAEMVEKQLDAMIQRRARKGDLDPDEREELWKASVRACNTRRREEMRAAWCEHHQGQAARLRTALEALIADHEEQAERYRDQPEGAA
jgi:hypothetical protein